MTTELWNDPRLALTPAEIDSLKMMPVAQAASLIKYMLGNGFFGMDFDHVPAILEKAFTNYRNHYAKLSQNTYGVGN